MMETFIAALAPVYTIAVGILVPLAIGYGLKLLQDRTGIQLEQSDRDALQTAIRNAALLAVQKSGGAPNIEAITGSALNAAVEQVNKSVPDAIGRFAKQGLDDENIATRIQVQAQAIVDSVPTVLVEAGKQAAVDAFIRRATQR